MMKKLGILFLSVFVLATLLASRNPVNAVVKSYCTTKANYQYCVLPASISPHVVPVYETQTQHTKGIETTVTMGTTQSTSRTYSGSLAVSFSTGFVLAESTVTAEVGVAKTESHSISYTVAYTVPATTDNGKYRIEHVFPSYNLLYGSYTIDGEIKQIVNKYTVPGKNEAYRRFTRYAN